MSDYTGRKISILGGGVSGVSLAMLALRLGASPFLSDAAKIPETFADRLRAAGIAFEEGGHTGIIMGADLVVISSGFPPTAKILKEVEKNGIPIAGELDFALPHIDAKVIGITGSNGKTTTTSLLGYLLSSIGLRAAVAGNIGTPIADFAAAGDACDYIAAELSSFQLHWARDISLSGAIVTNLAPDHIDWHGSYDNYVAAKAKVLSFIRDDGFGIVQERDVDVLNAVREGIYRLSWGGDGGTRKILLDTGSQAASIGGRELFSFNESGLIGAHNMENVAMALSAISLSGGDVAVARRHLAGYAPPPHRCALVLEKGGVRYVNDSKGTNVAATVTALSSIEGGKVIILGGKGKGEDYAPLVEPLKQFARCAILLGEEAGAIAAALTAGGFGALSFASGMEEAVRLAAAAAKAGDVVLLSPACTSWDMYKSYGERGDHFTSLVRDIIGGEV